jgi:hypothetical protein
MTDEYRVFDDAGTEIGTIREVELSKTKKLVRLFSHVDQFLTHKLGVWGSETPIMRLTCGFAAGGGDQPATLWIPEVSVRHSIR